MTKEERLAYNRAYYAKHPERFKAYREARKAGLKVYFREYREANADKLKVSRRRHLLRAYGLTLEQYDAMLVAQDYKCATCGVKDGECGGVGNRLVVDHMHCSGKVRALLCSNCNVVIGLLKENADVADAVASLIRKHQAH